MQRWQKYLILAKFVIHADFVSAKKSVSMARNGNRKAIMNWEKGKNF